MEKLDEERLRAEYEPKVDGRLERAKKLDRECKLPPTVAAYALGIVGTLLLGAGMCLAMEVIGSGPLAMGIGIAVGLLGIAAIAVNYPLCLKFLAKRKEKFSSSILLTLNEKE